MSLSHSPEFTYWVGQPAVAIEPPDRQWMAGLPLDRLVAQHPPEQKNCGQDVITYGAYFSTAREWLLQDNLAILRRAARHQLGYDPPPKTFQNVRIHLIKHGAFYHPAKVTLVAGDGDEVCLVLNLAVSTEGRAALKDEAANLVRLNQAFAERWVPHVYGSRPDFGKKRPLAEMFAAQWLTGFYEFHLTRGSSWVLWDDQLGPRPLSQDQAADIYEQAAYILTHYYNPLTFEAVGSWHHAAGDFVVRQTEDKLDVRLISVRRYSPILAPDNPSALSLESILDGLCLFLVDMSLRMRLDRIDGTGPAAVSPDVCLPAIWRGFKRGLDSVCRQHGLPMDFSQGVLDYLGAHSRQNLIGLGRHVLTRYPAEAQDTALLQDALEDHAVALIEAMEQVGP
jgi:hypothetical protein